jgi:CDP-diacylglycerol--glycerol-3-phosphate 3-phosphatidyltransferase
MRTKELAVDSPAANSRSGRNGRLAMGIYGIKPGFQRVLGGAERFLVARQVHPDYLTLTAMALSALGGLALYASNWHYWLLLLVPPVALARTALNALDGLVARDTGLARPWGEVLNEVCDRISDVALFTGVALAPGSNSALGACVLVIMLLSSYVGVLSKAAGGRRQFGGVMGKADRMIYLSAAALAAFFMPSMPVLSYLLLLVLAGLVVTVAQRLASTYADYQSIR